MSESEEELNDSEVDVEQSALDSVSTPKLRVFFLCASDMRKGSVLTLMIMAHTKSSC